MSDLLTILNEKERAVYSVASGATIQDAVSEMCRRRVGAVLVHSQDGERLEGIISERDVMSRVVLPGLDPRTTFVAEAMTTDVVCIGLDTEPDEAMQLMTEHRFRHLPVIDLEGDIVGIVSIGDLLRWVSRAQAFEIRTLTEYVSGGYPG